MKNYTFHINLIAELEGGFTVTVPQLPGCVSFGENIEEAQANIKEAIELHLENIKVNDKIQFRNLINRTVLSTAVQL